MVPTITIRELKALLNCIYIVDIRDTDDYYGNHIPGAINIPFEKLLTSYGTVLKKNVTYYLYCDRGKVSNKVVEILIKNGYKAINIDGGYDKWCQENKIC